MRLFIICLLLFLAPVAAVVIYRQYQAEQGPPALPANFGHRSNEVLFFNATWCGPCRQMKPVVSQLRRQGFHLRDVDVDQHRTLAKQYGIHAVPTFVFVEHGQEVKRFSGGTSPERLRKLCANYRF